MNYPFCSKCWIAVSLVFLLVCFPTVNFAADEERTDDQEFRIVPDADRLLALEEIAQYIRETGDQAYLDYLERNPETPDFAGLLNAFPSKKLHEFFKGSYGYWVTGNFYHVNGQKIAVTGICPGFEDRDPVKGFSDRKLIRMWKQEVRTAEGGDPDAIFRVNYVRALFLWFSKTYVGYPDEKISHLREVIRPKNHTDEVFQTFEDRTYLVEITVPQRPIAATLNALELYTNGDPNADVKLRGWYIKGDGVGGEHPLIIYQCGSANWGLRLINIFVPLVIEGFDVLFLDHRGHGWSEGSAEFIGGDTLDMIEQLLEGVKSYGPDDDLSGNPTKRMLLGPIGSADYSPEDTPIFLMGSSQGAIASFRAMAMNVDTGQVDAEFDEDGNLVFNGNTPRGFNIKGVIAMSSWEGSHKYECDPMLALAGGCGLSEFSANCLVPSSVYRSMDNWPGLFAIKPAQDYSSPHGTIVYYNNKLRGYKEILLIDGSHHTVNIATCKLYRIRKAVEWMKAVLANGDPPMTNNTKTSLRKELRMLPTQADFDAAEKWDKKLRRQWLKSH